MLKKYPEITSSKPSETLAPDSVVIQNILNYSKQLEVQKTKKQKPVLIHLN